MSKQKKKNQHEEEIKAEETEQGTGEEKADDQSQAADAQPEEVQGEKLNNELTAEKDKFLRLAAEYDNYRKRTQKEREGLYSEARAETVAQFLPVYDNLERALTHQTSDAAFYKGMEMIMAGFKEIMKKLDVEEIPATGETFDPKYHNAVMHVEDESKGTSEIVEQLQKGFKMGEKVIRFSLVKVAN